MAREIDLLRKAARKALTVVEKATNVVWTEADLGEAAAGEAFAGEDGFGPPPAAGPVSAPYPGCFGQLAASADTGRYRLVGQTRHFLIFAPPADGIPGPLPG